MAKIDFILQKFQDSIYNKEGSNIANLLNSMSAEFDIFLTQMQKVKDSKFVDYAIDSDLDKIGSIINVIRYFGESDAAYRGRIKATVPSFIGGGTIGAIQTVVQHFLGVTPMILEHYLPGNGHPTFKSGTLTDTIPTIKTGSGLVLNLSPGTSYINGTRITSISTDITLPINTTRYIKLQSDGTFIVDTTNAITGSQLLMADIVTNSTTITSVIDRRIMLDPFTDNVTNTASITVQIPYDFNAGFITIDNVKDILKKTRAAGIALLITIVQTFNDNINVHEVFDVNFIIGFSQLGDSNLIGGA